MANSEHVAKLKEGVEAWNRWRDEKPDVRPDLVRADLSRMKLSGANLVGVALLRADLSGANLVRANLGRALLGRAFLRGANLAGASLDGATLWETVLADIDLSEVNGLESCEHQGPSTIDHRTLAKSGLLPLKFLRGIGLPDTFIEYIPSLFNQPIQFYSCFISYSTQNEDFAERLEADLQSKGVRCWFAPHKMEGGRKLHEQIDEAIRLHDRLLLILSEDSMNSNWVADEIRRAFRKQEREGRAVLYPVRVCSFETLKEWELRESLGFDLAEEIRQYFIPDFSTWKTDHDTYKQELEKLIRKLTSLEGKEASAD